MRFFRNNGLSIVLFILFLISIVGQVFTGLQQHNQVLQDEGGQPKNLGAYLTSGHFLQSTFENWESEFLQMGIFVVLTIFLYQKGSSESKDPEGENEMDRQPDPNKKEAPWPVKKGGFTRKLYEHSLSIMLFTLFLLSFVVHWYGSLKDYNEEQMLKGKPMESAISFLSNSRLWFESFQNWQSEFISIFFMVIFTIFLRQKGSPQSKPVDAGYWEETGD